MKILITNDDGIFAPGIRELAKWAMKLGDVTVVAPKHEQSAKSHGINIIGEFEVKPVEFMPGVRAFSVDSTPADCIRYGIVGLGEQYDLVLSGINHGSNAAVNVMYSGTMGAAIEGSFYGVPSIGLSVDDHDADADFEGAVKYGREIISSVLAAADTLPRPLCLNVNVPRCGVEEIKGLRLCRQTRGFWREEFYEREDPQGRKYFWLTGAFQNAEPEATDSDEWALANKYVAVVPVQTDMTDYRQLTHLQGVIK
jgi:5'-nucleotidase